MLNSAARSTPGLFSPKSSDNDNSILLLPIPSCPSSNQTLHQYSCTIAPSNSSISPNITTLSSSSSPVTVLEIGNNNGHHPSNFLSNTNIANGSSQIKVPSSDDNKYTATTRHYVVSPVTHRNMNDPYYRQYSTSSETITEESSAFGSSMPSPAPTLPLSSPHSPLISPPLHNPHNETNIFNPRMGELARLTQFAHPNFQYRGSGLLPAQNCSEESTKVNVISPSEDASIRLQPYFRNEGGSNVFSALPVPLDHGNISHNPQNFDNSSQNPCTAKSETSTPVDGRKKSFGYSVDSQRQTLSPSGGLEPVRVAPPPPVQCSVSSPNLSGRLSNLELRSKSSPLAAPLQLPLQPTVFSTAAPTTLVCSSTSGSAPLAEKIDNRKGTKHVASLQFVPSSPHNAHLVSCPPNKGSVELSDRSYTSVNLRLRQPSSEPQPAIDIKSSGSCLTYSTSSLDRRQGSRSSLQISIGPSGGSISAMRTNLSTEMEQGNTAFHIQYRADDDTGHTCTSSTATTVTLASPTNITKPSKPKQPDNVVTTSSPSWLRQTSSSLHQRVTPQRFTFDERQKQNLEKHSAGQLRSERQKFDGSRRHTSRPSTIHIDSQTHPYDPHLTGFERPPRLLDDRLPGSPSEVVRDLGGGGGYLVMRDLNSSLHDRSGGYHERVPSYPSERYSKDNRRPQSWYAPNSPWMGPDVGCSPLSSRSKHHYSRRNSMPDGAHFAYYYTGNEHHPPPQHVRAQRRPMQHTWYEGRGPPDEEAPLVDDWTLNERIYVQGSSFAGGSCWPICVLTFPSY